MISRGFLSGMIKISQRSVNWCGFKKNWCQKWCRKYECTHGKRCSLCKDYLMKRSSECSY